MYRYGDGTPFPFQENFIDTLLAAIDCCVGTFAAAAELDDRREKTRNARREAEEELKKLALLEKALEMAVAPVKPSVDRAAPPTSQAAARALGAGKTAIGATRAMVEGRLSQLAGEPRSERAMQQARTALCGFFDRHQLPETAWRWSWSSTQTRTTGDAMALAGKFRLEYDLDLDGPWRQVVRVGAIAPGLHATVLVKKTFGGTKRARIALDRCGIVAVDASPERASVVLREHAAKPSPGWRVTVRDPDKGVTVVAVDLSGRASGEELALDGDDAAPFVKLWDAIECDFLEMLDARRRMTALHLGDAALDDIGDPSVLGRTLLSVLGPVVVEIRKRSRVPGELAIKRDIGDGRREELYVPRADIDRRFQALPHLYRRPFEEIGLGRPDTVEVLEEVIREVASADPEPQTLPEVTMQRGPTLSRLPAVPPTPLPRVPLRAVP
jgi:hypothetical protein